MKCIFCIFFFILVFAQNYMDRVEAAFIANGESYKFTEFENLLKSFDSTTEKASDLYIVSNLVWIHKRTAELEFSAKRRRHSPPPSFCRGVSHE